MIVAGHMPPPMAFAGPIGAAHTQSGIGAPSSAGQSLTPCRSPPRALGAQSSWAVHTQAMAPRRAPGSPPRGSPSGPMGSGAAGSGPLAAAKAAPQAVAAPLAGAPRRAPRACRQHVSRQLDFDLGPASAPSEGESHTARWLFGMMDITGCGRVSKLEFITAVQRYQEVNDFVLPGLDSSNLLSDVDGFDIVDRLFVAIAAGRSRFSCADFAAYFRAAHEPSGQDLGRSTRRVLIIGPGFGREINPRQGIMIEQAGYQVHWVCNVPNPEQHSFPVAPYLGTIAAEIERFRPDVVACASKGGVYVVGLWQTGIWRGPTLLINAHPCCQQLPKDVPVVIAHGANDEVYPASRQELEDLVASGTPSLCFLYWTANSGMISPGMFTREGDRHNMESLLLRDCLPRLIDSLMCPDGPEVHMVRTWRDRLCEDRIIAERWLGYTPARLRRLWQSQDLPQRQLLFPVSPQSEEWARVVTAFKASPKEAPAYLLYSPAEWERVQVLRIDRVENQTQQEGSTAPYCHALQRSIEDQGVEFEPGVHTCWAFHGADGEALQSIVTNPVVGFQPLVSGSRNSALWGAGTYFARDAQYVAGSHFCGPPAVDGTRQMLMCLLMTGIPCLGDPEHRGVLPIRQHPHRYHSSVDSLCSPEVYVVQSPGAALPAYILSFA